jgi:hypothetical protein
VWPQVLDALVIAKPATVLKWASQGLSDLLAAAITPSRTPQDERRNPRPDPPHFSGTHLRRVLSCYFRYYHGNRTHGVSAVLKVSRSKKSNV